MRLNSKLYAEHWEKEAELFESKGIYELLSEITPKENVLEIGSGIGLSTVTLAASRNVMALDNNVHLVSKAQAHLTAAGVSTEIVVADIFNLSAQVVDDIKEFKPKVIVGWFLGSSAEDQDKYATTDIQSNEQAKKYREHMEDAMLKEGICQPSVEWVHLVNRTGMITLVSEILAKEAIKADYDTHVFHPKGFEIVDVQILDWNLIGSSFHYGAVHNPNLLQGQLVPKLVSLLAKRKSV